jgi:adenylate kinase
MIFDGYPRNKQQAENLNKLLNNYNQKIDLVLKLSVSLDVIKKRITGRAVCSICGKIYNEYFNPAPVNSNCCSSRFLQKRSDDTLDISISRYQTYEKNIKPVIDFYEGSKLLRVVNGEMNISEITNEISHLIEAIKG